jgi:hypothetical protein
MATGDRPANWSNPNDVMAWLDKVVDGDGALVGVDADTLTAVSALTVDGTWDADAATVVNSIRATLNEVVTILTAMGASAT